jgi:hypothetical protein
MSTMMQFLTQRKILSTGEYVPDWVVSCEIRLPGGSSRIRRDFKIDTQCDRIMVGLPFAARLQLDPQELRRTAPRVRIGTATGGHFLAYLWDVQFRLEDNFGGWAEWTATTAFAEPDPKSCYAGKAGFLQFLRFSDNGPRFSLDPVPGFPGRHS